MHSTLAPPLIGHFVLSFEPALCDRYERPFCSPYWVLRDTHHDGSVIGHTDHRMFEERVIAFLTAQPGAASEAELRHQVNDILEGLLATASESEHHVS